MVAVFQRTNNAAAWLSGMGWREHSKTNIEITFYLERTACHLLPLNQHLPCHLFEVHLPVIKHKSWKTTSHHFWHFLRTATSTLEMAHLFLITQRLSDMSLIPWQNQGQFDTQVHHPGQWILSYPVFSGKKHLYFKNTIEKDDAKTLT